MKRRVLVTGGARGLGQAMATRLTADGYEVVTPTREELDLASATSVERWLVSQRDEHFDVLVNNAGENKVAPLVETELADWERMATVNLTSPFLLVRALGQKMAARGWGRIVNVSSIFGSLARSGRAPYSASKAGLEALTRAAALELAPHGVLVNALAPGYVETDLTRRNNDPAQIDRLAAAIPLGRLAQPDEIANVALFLVSERNTYMTGVTLFVDGGFSIQ